MSSIHYCDELIAYLTTPSLSRSMLGHIDDMGILYGSMKFASDGGTPKLLSLPGVEKSSISLLKKIPVRLPRTFEPKLQQQTTIRLSVDANRVYM